MLSCREIAFLRRNNINVVMESTHVQEKKDFKKDFMKSVIESGKAIMLYRFL